MDKSSEKQILNCSRCGLCMDVCPIYKIKKTETSSLRGKLLQLFGILKGELRFEKKIKKNIELCLACGRCKEACPSDINTIKIFSEVKNQNLTLAEKFFYSAPIFKLKMLALKIFYKLKYPLGKKNVLKINQNALHFKGCTTSATGSFIKLKKTGKFACCGLPFYVKGKINLYEKYKNRNIKQIKKADLVVFDCATCYDTVLKYEGLDDFDKTKLMYFTDFYKNLNLYSKKPLKIVFHKPCHLPEKKFNEIKELLSGIKNIEFESDKECCGFGGDFFLKHPKIAHALSLSKIEKAINSGADIILTTCPSCLWSLKYGIKFKKSKLKAYDLAEFLAILQKK